MKSAAPRIDLRLPPKRDISWTNRQDPLRFYYWPFVGRLYRQRYEYCLGQCRNGQRVLEIGYGSGLALFNLHEMYEDVYGLDMQTDAIQAMTTYQEQGLEVQLATGSILDMPYEDSFFDTVLAVSILEHLKPEELPLAMQEIHRVLKPEAQLVYGVPVQRVLMTVAFRVLGYNIKNYHFSSEEDVSEAAGACFKQISIVQLRSIMFMFGSIYEIGHFRKVNRPQAEVELK